MQNWKCVRFGKLLTNYGETRCDYISFWWFWKDAYRCSTFFLTLHILSDGDNNRNSSETEWKMWKSLLLIWKVWRQWFRNKSQCVCWMWNGWIILERIWIVVYGPLSVLIPIITSGFRIFLCLFLFSFFLLCKIVLDFARYTSRIVAVESRRTNR